MNLLQISSSLSIFFKLLINMKEKVSRAMGQICIYSEINNPDIIGVTWYGIRKCKEKEGF